MTTTFTPPTTTPPVPGPRYPRTERQADIIALADRMAVIAAANAPRHDRDGTFPHETFAALRASGYLALTVPEEYGGGGATPLEVMLAQERLARGDGSVALAAAMHLGHVAGIAVNDAWPPELKEMFLRAVADEGALYNTAASEPGLGSPSRGGHFATRAVREGDGWRINGRKAWTTLAPELAYVGVQLSVEEENGELSRATFLVPADTPGVRIEETWDNLGMRASGSHDIVLEDVIVPDAYRLPAAGKPEGGPWSVLTSAVYLGIGVAARDFAIAFARDRRPTAMNGKAIAELQNVQHRIAQIELLLLASRSALYGTVETWQVRPELRSELAAQFAAAKVIVTNNTIDITDQALRVVGSAGMQRRHPLERYFRDARAGLGNPPMDDVALTMIGKAALGVS